MCEVLNMSGFWVFQACKYGRVLNFQGYTGFTYFCKYDRVLNVHGDAVMKWFWIFQDLNIYAKFLHMQALHRVLNMSGYGWIMPEETFLIVEGFWICLVKVWQVYEFASVSKYARTWNKIVNMWGLYRVGNKPEYALIMFSMCEYTLKLVSTIFYLFFHQMIAL